MANISEPISQKKHIMSDIFMGISCLMVTLIMFVLPTISSKTVDFSEHKNLKEYRIDKISYQVTQLLTDFKYLK